MKRIKFTLQDSRNRLLFLGGLILFMFKKKRGGLHTALKLSASAAGK